MPIYEQGYRRYEARGPLRQIRFWPITREALRLLLAKRAFLGLLALSWLPFVGFVIFIYAVTQFREAADRILAVDARLFGQFFLWQMSLALLLTTFGAAGLIANDLQSGGILVYLSRPLTRRDYVIGKLCVPLALNLAITLVPGLLLYGVGLALAPDYLLKASLAWIAPAIVVYSLAMSLSFSLLALAVSALSRSARVAGLGFFALVVGLEIVRVVLDAGFGRPEARLLSPRSNVEVLDSVIFGLGRHGDVPWAWSAGVLVLTGLACLAILRSRVRAVEVVR
jgi:ABC-2 type transport system permease protein